MKIKARPEDFVVDERIALDLAKDGQHRIYRMRKRGWNTLDAVEALARPAGIPGSYIRYAGLKDRRAVTSQHVSVLRRYKLPLTVSGVDPADLSVEEVGFSDDFVSARCLVGNGFRIVLRSLDAEQEETVVERLGAVRSTGFANYYDDQRFGSVSLQSEFMAEKVLKGHLRGALKIYLSACYGGETQAEILRRQALADAWGDWNAVKNLGKTYLEKHIAEVLLKGASKKNLLCALNAIPHNEMAFHFAAFQAAVWNGVLRAVVRESGQVAYSVRGKVGDYCFPSEAIPNVDIPTVARRVLPASPEVEAMIGEAVAARGLSSSDFNLRGVRNAYLKSFYRSSLVVPGELQMGEAQSDDLFRGKRKMVLRFDLPRGSYATMLLKFLGGPPAV